MHLELPKSPKLKKRRTTPTLSRPPGLVFGQRLQFRIELVMQLPGVKVYEKVSIQNWKQIMEPLRVALTEGTRMAFRRDTYFNERDKSALWIESPTLWTITRIEDSGCVGIFSPTFNYNERKTWTTKVRQTFDVLKELNIEPSNSWGTKIHIRHYPFLVPDEFKALAKTVLQYTHGFNMMAWNIQKNNLNPHSESLVWHPMVMGGYIAPCISAIDLAEGPEDVAILMNSDRHQMPAQSRPWNFWPAVPPENVSGYYYTNYVQYNMAPGCSTADDTIAWADFVNLFVRGAVTYNAGVGVPGQRPMPKSGYALSDLTAFIRGQASTATLTDHELRCLYLLVPHKGKSFEEWYADREMI
ncbi:hypothetical protein F4777DRAFT_584798 [Nemania sp. FL0916]|nr:hypothetical protein F4777DRAFT_584798 [Nemania sp. FL0916]